MDGIILMASPSAAQMFRYNSPKEMIGTSYSSIFKNFHDKDPLVKKIGSSENRISGILIVIASL